MPILKQKHILRHDVKNNRDRIYVFGDNEIRKGLGGQAAQMRGEPNAVGIRTKWLPAKTTQSYWTDDTYDCNCAKIDEDVLILIAALLCGRTVVIPSDGIGTGRAKMKEFCPRTFEYLQSKLEKLNEIIQCS